MPLIRRIELLLLLLLSLLTAVTLVAYFTIVDARFAELEAQQHNADRERAQATLSNELERLELLAAEWASWDDTYAFMSDGNVDYLEANFEAFDYYALNLFLFIRPNNEIRHAVAWDYRSGDPLSFPSFEDPLQRQSLVLGPGEDGSLLGFVQTTHGPMMVSVLDIMRSDDTGPPAGRLVAGRLLDAEHLSNVRRLSQLPLELASPGSVAGTSLIAVDFPAIGPPLPTRLVFQPSDAIRTQANQTLVSFLGALMLAFGAIWIALRWMLARVITQPLEGLTASLTRVRDQGNLPAAVTTARSDEIGALAQAYNEMLDRLRMSQQLQSRSEAALQQQLLDARRTEDLGRIGSYVWDWHAHQLISCSEGFAAMRGMSVEQTLAAYGSPEADLNSIHPEDRDHHEQVESSAIAARAPGYTVSYRLLLPDERVLHIREICQLEYDDAGGIHLTHGSSQDITNLVRMEEELRRAQKLEALGQLAGGIAHDFNNLLMVIIGNLQMSQHAVGTGQAQARFVQASLGAAQKAATLVDRLLSYGQKQPLHTTRFDVRDTVQGMRETVQQVLGEGIRTEVVLAEEACAVDADEVQLESALLNLVINAGHAMPRGGKLSIEVARRHLTGALGDLAPGDYVSITVADDGVGMPADVIDRAFDPFFTTRGTGQGSGLGLSMVYGYCRQLRGRVDIESEPGAGTRVQIDLPAGAGVTAQAPTTPLHPVSRRF